jgi:hypothetical protein
MYNYTLCGGGVRMILDVPARPTKATVLARGPKTGSQLPQIPFAWNFKDVAILYFSSVRYICVSL